MRHYEVFISDEANGDMEAIYDYSVETFHAPITAAKQYNRIAEAVLTLEEMPERIRLMDS